MFERFWRVRGRAHSRPRPVVVPQYKTVEQALADGTIDPQALARVGQFPPHGITILSPDRRTQAWFSGWNGDTGWKAHMKSVYLGGKSPLTPIAVGPRVVVPVEDQHAPNV